jgi:lactoylglutathione lyase
MPEASVVFDHVHLLSKDPQATADWLVDKLGAVIKRSVTLLGAPQLYVELGPALIIVRGLRGDEKPANKGGTEWGIDHFGVRVQGDFESFCAGLKKKGVRFLVEPKDFTGTTRISFIEGPDNIVIEVLWRGEGV